MWDWKIDYFLRSYLWPFVGFSDCEGVNVNFDFWHVVNLVNIAHAHTHKQTGTHERVTCTTWLILLIQIYAHLLDKSFFWRPVCLSEVSLTRQHIVRDDNIQEMWVDINRMVVSKSGKPLTSYKIAWKYFRLRNMHIFCINFIFCLGRNFQTYWYSNNDISPRNIIWRQQIMNEGSDCPKK